MIRLETLFKGRLLRTIFNTTNVHYPLLLNINPSNTQSGFNIQVAPKRSYARDFMGDLFSISAAAECDSAGVVSNKH